MATIVRSRCGACGGSTAWTDADGDLVCGMCGRVIQQGFEKRRDPLRGLSSELISAARAQSGERRGQHTGGRPAKDAEVLELLRLAGEPLSAPAIAEAIGAHVNSIYRMLYRLSATGVIRESPSRGRSQAQYWEMAS